MEEKVYKLVVVGPTGAGKSQFCNFVKKDTTNSCYKVGHTMDSCTKETFSDTFQRNKINLELIDTPGSNDSSNNDTINLQNLVDFIKKKMK